MSITKPQVPKYSLRIIVLSQAQFTSDRLSFGDVCMYVCMCVCVYEYMRLCEKEERIENKMRKKEDRNMELKSIMGYRKFQNRKTVMPFSIFIYSLFA